MRIAVRSAGLYSQVSLGAGKGILDPVWQTAVTVCVAEEARGWVTAIVESSYGLASLIGLPHSSAPSVA